MTHWDSSRRRFLGGIAAVTVGATLPGARARAGTTLALPGHGIRFGVLARQGASYADTLGFCHEAERLGFDVAYVNDHFMGAIPGPAESERCFEAWSLISALAAQTERIRIGVLVTGSTYRHPAVVAKMAATVDHVSRGRVIIGMGAAWLEREHIALGIPFYTPGIRARRLVESVEVVKRLFTQAKTTFEGKFYALKDAPFEPKSIQKPHPPILIGGLGDKVVQPLAARHAQIWHFLPHAPDPAEVGRLCAGFDKVCADVGRDPREVEKATSIMPKALEAPAKELRAQLRVLVDAGVRQFVLPPLQASQELADIRRFAKEIMPELRRV